MKTYTTFAGAQRAANGKPILRVLDDPDETWVVLNRLDTRVMIYTAEGRKYSHAGSADVMEIAAT